MRYLLNTTEIYRVDLEEDAKAMIEEASNHYNLVDAGYKYKEKKQKGEVIEFWYQVKIVKKWNDEKEPEIAVKVSYEKESAF